MLKKLVAIAALAFIGFGCLSDAPTGSESNDIGTGKGGSMARFAINGDRLFIVSNTSLHQFKLQPGTAPQKLFTTVLASSDVETIIATDTMLFLGTQSGMLIFRVRGHEKAYYLSTYSHITSCDPVVVQGNYAYTTLRTNTECSRGVNLLDIVDISNPERPFRVQSYGMHNPHGLGIDDSLLFVCDGEEGLKVWNCKDSRALKFKQAFQNIHAYDVIAWDGLLMLIGDDGLFQYDYKGESLELLSTIGITK